MTISNNRHGVVRIVPIEPDDVQAVRMLHKTAWLGIAGAYHSTVQNKAHVALIESDVYASALLSNNLLLARSADGSVLGSAGWCPYDAAHNTARIRKVFVHPEHAGGGLGRTLVDAAERDARSAGYTSFYVRANANAEPFYARLGYRAVKRGEMDANGTALPVIFMEKPIPEVSGAQDA